VSGIGPKQKTRLVRQVFCKVKDIKSSYLRVRLYLTGSLGLGGTSERTYTELVTQTKLTGVPMSIVAAIPPQGTIPTEISAKVLPPVPIMKAIWKPVGKGKVPGAEIVPIVALAVVLPMEVIATLLEPKGADCDKLRVALCPWSNDIDRMGFSA
jgi:hypothetical protein